MTTSSLSSPTFGLLLRDWRRRRRLSQLALACDAEVSQRHLSFVESGRARPSRDMVLRLAEQLEVPLRERNELLAAAGFAPLYRARAFDDPGLAAARSAVDQILRGQEPHPALAVDRHWNLLLANRALAPLLAGAAPALLRAPVNVLRLALHPEGLAPRIANYRDWRAHLLSRLVRQIEHSGDRVLAELLEELKAFPVPAAALPPRPGAAEAFAGLAVPLELRTEAGLLRLLSTTTVFGTALEVSLAELTIETFLPADAQSAETLGRLWQDDEGPPR